MLFRFRRDRRGDGGVAEALRDGAAESRRDAKRSRRLQWVAIGLAAVAASVAVVGWLSDWWVERQPFEILIDTDTDSMRDPAGLPLGSAYLVAAPIEEIGDPPGPNNECAGRRHWAKGLGGFDAGLTLIEVSLEGLRSNTARLLDMTPIITERRPPAVGSHIGCPGRGGGATEVFAGHIVLDEQPVFRVFGPDGTPIDFLFDLGQGDVVAFQITALALDCDCDWHLVLDYESNGERRSLIIDDNGAPFRTSSSVNARTYHFQQGVWLDIDAQAAAAAASDAGSRVTADECLLVDHDTIYRAAGADGMFLQYVELDSHGPTGVPMRHHSCLFMFDVGLDAPLSASVEHLRYGSEQAAEDDFEQLTRLYAAGDMTIVDRQDSEHGQEAAIGANVGVHLILDESNIYIGQIQPALAGPAATRTIAVATSDATE